MATDLSDIRPGSHPDHKYPGFEYVRASGGDWDKISSSDRETGRWESEINKARAALDQAVVALRLAGVMVHGGHVKKGLMQTSGVSTSMTPDQVIARVMTLMPDEIPAVG